MKRIPEARPRVIYISNDLAQETARLLDSFATQSPAEGVVYWFGIEGADVGVVTTLIPRAPFDPLYTVAMICGRSGSMSRASPPSSNTPGRATRSLRLMSAFRLSFWAMRRSSTR